MSAVVVLTAVAASYDARQLARDLVELRVAACVNIVGGVTSVYRWEGAVQEEGEQILVMKTTRESVDKLRDTLFARHPYEVPEFVVIPIESASVAYAAWIAASTTA